MEHNIKRFVAWGHKLHTHTHSYIHNAFIRAFQHLGYPTLWLDNNDDISGIDFEGSLFLTEGQVHQNIPVLASCYYILHNIPDLNRFQNVPNSHKLMLQVYTHDVANRPTIKCFEPFIYQEFGNGLSMPWATDLLPHEIDKNIKQLDTIASASPPELNFIGMPTPPWDIVSNYCRTHGITYKQVGGFSKSNVDLSHNIELIKHGVDGFLFDPNNNSSAAAYLAELICNPRLLNQFSKASQEKMSKLFSKNATANQEIKTICML
jgi:hypothetical protein